MASEPIEQFPPLIQLLLYIGVIIVGGAAWLVGGRNGKSRDDPDAARRERELAAAREREYAAARELNEAIRKLDRAETASEIERMSAAMERVIGALREAIVNKIDQGYARLAALEQAAARIEQAVARIEERLKRGTR